MDTFLVLAISIAINATCCGAMEHGNVSENVDHSSTDQKVDHASTDQKVDHDSFGQNIDRGIDKSADELKQLFQQIDLDKKLNNFNHAVAKELGSLNQYVKDGIKKFLNDADLHRMGQEWSKDQQEMGASFQHWLNGNGSESKSNHSSSDDSHRSEKDR